ncbi:MAG TPA: hypothetical protein VKZ58_00580 [Longimicrobiales bacterium]|nr:hypothetical protein [Longimicrobiales bacterium]
MLRTLRLWLVMFALLGTGSVLTACMASPVDIVQYEDEDDDDLPEAPGGEGFTNNN